MKEAWGKRFVRQLTIFAVLVLLFAYVAGDAIRGTHGLIAKQRLD